MGGQNGPQADADASGASVKPQAKPYTLTLNAKPYTPNPLPVIAPEVHRSSLCTILEIPGYAPRLAGQVMIRTRMSRV
jgi:hypothetical protein